MYLPLILSSTERLWIKVGEFPNIGFTYFRPMGRISRKFWLLQKVFYYPLLLFSNPKRFQNFILVKSGKLFHGSINCHMSYINLPVDSKVQMANSMLLSEIHLGAGFKVSSPEVLQVDVSKGICKVCFVQGFKKLVTSEYELLFPILKDLYSQGDLISYKDRIGNSPMSDMVVREGACHGDFAAFNMFFVKSDIVLIDWNDSFRKGPIIYDLTYYLVSSIVLFNVAISKSKARCVIEKFVLYLGLEISPNFILFELKEVHRIWLDKGVNKNMVRSLENFL